MIKMGASLLIFIVTSLINPALAQDKLVFSVAPTQSVFETKKLFAPIAEYLSAATGREIVLKASSSYPGYVSRMMSDRFDILLDGPHFTSWRMKRKQHVPLVRLPGTIQIVVVTREDSGISDLDELSRGGGVRVCSFDSPNILTMALRSYFPNPLRQPRFKRVKNDRDLETCIQKGRGRAGVFNREHWERMDQTGLSVLYTADSSYPGMTLSVGPKVDQATRKLIAEALLSSEAKGATSAALNHYHKERFIAADPKDYQGLDQLLSGVWGFE